MLDWRSILLVFLVTGAVSYISVRLLDSPLYEYRPVKPIPATKATVSPYSEPAGIEYAGGTGEQLPVIPPSPKLSPADSLVLVKELILPVEYGVKSVVFNPDKSSIFSLNLEGLSVYEYGRSDRKFKRYIRFRKTPAKGFDYEEKKPIDSWEEKPVEGCFSHGGKFFWISLHNAGAVVVWNVKDKQNHTAVEGKPFKIVDEFTLKGTDEKGKRLFDQKETRLLSIKTGKTPKIIGASPDGKYLFVTNWHSFTTSVIDISSPLPEKWTKIKDLAHGAIPRGLVISPDSKYLYVAIMGGTVVQVFDLTTFEKVKTISVGDNPRHIVLKDNYLYVSLNAGDKILKYNLSTDKIEKRASTAESPRTITVSDDGRYLFVVCYKADRLEVYDTENLKRVGSFKSHEKPIGVEVYQNGDIYETWVCNYTSGTMRVFDLKESP